MLLQTRTTHSEMCRRGERSEDTNQQAWRALEHVTIPTQLVRCCLGAQCACNIVTRHYVKTEHGGKDMMSLSRCVEYCKRDVDPKETASEWHTPFSYTTKLGHTDKIGRCELCGPFGSAEISRRSFLPTEDSDKESLSIGRLHTHLIHSNLANGQPDTAVSEKSDKAIPFNVASLPGPPPPP